MKSISINGAKLHEVKMHLVPHSCGVVSYSLFPKNRIFFELHEDTIELIVPTRLGLEMYRIGILPQDENQLVSVCVSGKSIGSYKVVNFLYPNNHDDVVNITLQK
ncbi:MAG: hypothetical protein GY787_32260 [Alteromonadales bacterium]|nr:hypothetical protein [Alteromonadales bacterium]